MQQTELSLDSGLPGMAPQPPRRVRVAIRNPESYAAGCAEMLQGAVGRVIRDKEHSCNGERSFGPASLVEFDAPLASWWSGGSPVTAFWFPPCDIEPIV